MNMLINEKADKFDIYNVLASDKEENIEYDGFLTSYSQAPEEAYKDWNKHYQEAKTIDSFGLKNVGFIKIDAEGMEEKIIRGAMKTIIENDYPPILFELWDVGHWNMTQERHDSTERLIRSLGYDILWYWGDFETHLAVKRKQDPEKVVDIVYIATDVYASYIEDFLGTIHNFLPGYDKRIHAISDGLKEYDGYNKDGVSIDVTYQTNLPYPLIPLSKTYFIKSLLTDDMKYVFYFDADTKFLERSPEYWADFEEMMKSDKMLLSNHPGNYWPTYEIAETSNAYLAPEDYKITIMSSLFGGTKDAMEWFCNEICPLIKNDLNYHRDHQYHYIPSLFDQDYVNKVLNMRTEDRYIVRYFSHISWFHNEQDIDSENLVEQKYDISRKFDKKNML